MQRDQVLIAPAERADVIVDFASVPVGTELYLIIEGPDKAFQGGKAGTDYFPADPATTGQIMKLVIEALTSPDTTVPPSQLSLPSFEPLGKASRIRRLSLSEQKSASLPNVGPRQMLLGTLDRNGAPVPMRWDDPVTENPALGATEIWEIHDFTKDAHPIHVHEVQFQVLDRQQAAALRGPPSRGRRGSRTQQSPIRVP